MENNRTSNEIKSMIPHPGEEDPEAKTNLHIIHSSSNNGKIASPRYYSKPYGKKYDENKEYSNYNYHYVRESVNKAGPRHYSHTYNKNIHHCNYNGNNLYNYHTILYDNMNSDTSTAYNANINSNSTHSSHSLAHNIHHNSHHMHSVHLPHNNYSHSNSSHTLHSTIQNRTNSISYYHRNLSKKSSITNTVNAPNSNLNQANQNLVNNTNFKYVNYKKHKKSLNPGLNSNTSNNITATKISQLNPNNVNNVNYSNFANFSNSSNFINFTGSSYLNSKSYKYSNSTLKKLIFINAYDKCNDFSNYKNFLTVNLKFLKQNYKLKENLNNNNTADKTSYNPDNVLYLHQNMGISENDTSNKENTNNNAMFYFNPYLNVNMMNLNINLSMNVNKQVSTENYLQSTIQNKPQAVTEVSSSAPQNKISKNSEAYYDNQKLQPYSFIKDQNLIEQNLKTGRYLKGVIRINKCHTHGYITVSGLANDILIRGNRNLNQSLHLDEVIVELFPMACWKPLFNKKLRKFSVFAEQITNKSEKNQENIFNEIYNTDAEENDEQIDINLEKKRRESVSEHEDNGMNFKENFDNPEERLAYLNKIYNLRPEGRIVKILKSPNGEEAHIVRIVSEKQLIFACPIDENLPKIFIKMKKFRRVEFVKKLESDFNFRNKYFLVRIVGWALNFKCPKGIIVNELGNSGDIEVETEVLLRTYDIDYGEEYPQQAMEELKQYDNWKIDEEIEKERVDLREDIIFTIDPKTSKDLDDAISVKIINEAEGLLEIGVHIADPSHFVRKDSLLDKEAMNRTTTVYLVQKNIPMLPRILSENLCSLLPYQDRLAFSCVFRIYLNGALETNFAPKFFLSIINSSGKWNYELVQKIIDDEDVIYEELSNEHGTKPITKEIFEKMCEKVKILHKLTKLVRSQRIESGSLIIDKKEVSFELNEETKMPIGYKFKTKTDSNHMIEELMLIANKLTAEYLFENIRHDALIRKHPFINDNKFQEIHRYFTMNKVIVDFEDPQALNDMMMKIKSKDLNKYICIQNKLKNFMQRAEYVICANSDLQDLRHSALNFELYTHFTSPIRRYPDMIVHRQLKYILHKRNLISGHSIKSDDHTGYDMFIDYFNEKYVNGKMISNKCGKVFHCLMIRNTPMKSYKALVVDINYKHLNKNKRASNAAGINFNFKNTNTSQNETGPTLVINLLIQELGLEIVKYYFY